MTETEYSAQVLILLVEDNEMNRDMLSRRLRKRGYEVVLAEDAEKALEYLSKTLPDIVLMDISLPGMDGLEATRRIRTFASRNELPIIALTAHATIMDREVAMQAGCNAFETKPIKLANVLLKMSDCLAARTRFREQNL
ncbi:response regulator [Aestuariispira insulae]|uniref:Response regulator receiver domain-containing protein n=1 Tax=Aestuariispira insulae TaxID=1461337 RepID=A0A3D9HRV9_9PROT|nr:response regulator [Aestuariispira insulae]RED52061.1 response regulator receiver domain-containing protein [Aestuariispira insulae]